MLLRVTCGTGIVLYTHFLFQQTKAIFTAAVSSLIENFKRLMDFSPKV